MIKNNKQTKLKWKDLSVGFLFIATRFVSLLFEFDWSFACSWIQILFDSDSILFKWMIFFKISRHESADEPTLFSRSKILM